MLLYYTAIINHGGKVGEKEEEENKCTLQNCQQTDNNLSNYLYIIPQTLFSFQRDCARTTYNLKYVRMYLKDFQLQLKELANKGMF